MWNVSELFSIFHLPGTVREMLRPGGVCWAATPVNTFITLYLRRLPRPPDHTAWMPEVSVCSHRQGTAGITGTPAATRVNHSPSSSHLNFCEYVCALVMKSQEKVETVTLIGVAL